MKILIAGLKNNYQVKRLKIEGKKRGHVVDGVSSRDLFIVSDKTGFLPRLKNNDITSYDLIYSFVSKRRWEWYMAFNYLAQEFGTKIINNKIVDPKNKFFRSPVTIEDYYFLTKEKINYPKSVAVYSENTAKIAVKILGGYPLIAKSSDGSQGKEVFKIASEKDLLSVVNKLSVLGKTIIIREFIPNDGDIRVFCISGKVIGAMQRKPKNGEYRSNISQGGVGSNFYLSKNPEVKNIAEKAAKATSVDIAGVDVMINKNTNVPYILEVNACPQIEGFEKYTKLNVASEIIRYFESLVKSV